MNLQTVLANKSVTSFVQTSKTEISQLCPLCACPQPRPGGPHTGPVPRGGLFPGIVLASAPLRESIVLCITLSRRVDVGIFLGVLLSAAVAAPTVMVVVGAATVDAVAEQGLVVRREAEVMRLQGRRCWVADAGGTTAVAAAVESVSCGG